MKYLKLLLVILIVFTFNVSASTNVELRSENDLKIHDSIIVDKNNIDNILKTPKVNENEKVYDFANLFNDLYELTIYNNIIGYINLTNYDLAVVTIDDNNKNDEKEYADDFYDYNYFGFDDSFSGLLILIDMDNRGIYISRTGLASEMYTTMRIENLIDYGWDDLVNGDYNNCILKIINKMKDYYNQGFPSSDKEGISSYLMYSFVIGAIISTVVSIIMYNKSRLKIKANNVVSYLVSEHDLNITKNFLRSDISRVRRNDDSSGSNFGRSGGSSSHRGSSGRSHGGGGRRF